MTLAVTTGPLIHSPRDVHDPSRLMTIATDGSIRKTHLSLAHPWEPLTGCPAFENSHRERLVIRKPKPLTLWGDKA